MAVTRSSASAEDLLSHAGWLRRLAEHLVQDGDVAQDAVQEVWARVQTAPFVAGSPPRPWLAEILRNVVRMRLRSENRRAKHETAAAQEAPRSIASVESAYERLEMHRAVVESVMALEEPLRLTIVLRYFEERSSGEIAHLMGDPAGTVRWRLSTAIERIRNDLDRRFGGDRRRWVVALAPLGKGALIVMSTKAKLGVGIGLAVVFLGGTWFWRPWKGIPTTERGSVPAKSSAATTPAPTESGAVINRGSQVAAVAPPKFVAEASSKGAGESSEPGVAASPSKEALRAAIRTAIPVIKRCYEKLLVTDPGASGRVVVNFTIEEKRGVGRISEATIRRKETDGGIPDLASPITEQCILNTLAETEFPAPKGGRFHVTYPFVLSPGKRDAGAP